MRINEHSLESLRKVVRDLQQENQALKEILEENNIPYESRNVLEERPLPDEYDEDQGARILPYYPFSSVCSKVEQFTMSESKG